WMRFVLAQLATGEPSTFRSVEDVVPSVGYHRNAPVLLPGGGRLIKTHEPYRRDYRRAIYLVRDVRSVLMSHYRMLTRSKFPDMSFDTFLGEFVRGSLDGYGTWQEHIGSWTTR